MDIKSIVKEDFIVLDDQTSLAELIGKLRSQEKRSSLIFRKQKYIGLVEKKKLLRVRLDSTEVKLGKYVQQTPILNSNTEVLEAALRMFESGAEYLPVQENKKIIGVVDGVSLARLAVDLPQAKKLTVSDIKLSQPAKIGLDDPIALVIDAMHDESADLFPVFDKGKISTVIAYKDILRRYLNWSPKRDLSVQYNSMISSRSTEAEIPHTSALPVRDFSSNRELVTVTPVTKLSDALDLLQKNVLVSAVVMDKDTYKGILTTKNILKALAALVETQNYSVQYIGLKELNLMPHQQASIQRIIDTEAPKIEYEINNPFILVFHFKEYNKKGTRQKFSVHLRVEYPGKVIVCEDDDWKIEDALHKVFDHLGNAVKKKFHGDTTKGRTYQK